MNWRRKRASEGLARGRVGGIRSKTDMNTWPRSLPVSQDRLWLRGWWRHDICRVPQRRRRVQCGQPDQGRLGVERGYRGGHTARHTQGLVVTQQHMWSHSNSCGHKVTHVTTGHTLSLVVTHYLLWSHSSVSCGHTAGHSPTQSRVPCLWSPHQSPSDTASSSPHSSRNPDQEKHQYSFLKEFS